MGWKSSKKIDRRTAIRKLTDHIASLDNYKLADVMEAVGFGDDFNLDYYGYNFEIVDNLYDDEE